MFWKSLAFSSVLVFISATGFGQIKREIVQNAKIATALVERPSGDGFGSAFCISKSGFFITNEHVISGESKEIPLIINPGTKNEKKLLSEIVRKDEKRDLALLRLITPPADLKTLGLGNDSGLFETQQISVFGYPFGTSLALRNKKYPNVSINVGRITSLRKSGSTLKMIQLDAVVNPGNSGGPVLDDSGKVIGVVVEKVIGTDVNFAIPISVLKSFLQRPELFVKANEIRFANRHAPVQLQFGTLAYGKQSETFRLELRLENGVDKSTFFKVDKPDSNGMFSVETSPVSKTSTPTMLPVTVTMKSGVVKGEMAEQRIQLGSSIQYIVEMRSIKKSSDQWLIKRFDGKTAKLPSIKLEDPTIHLGGSKISLDLNSVKQIQFGLPKKFAKQITYQAKLIGSNGSVVIKKGVLPLVGAPSDGETDLADVDNATNSNGSEGLLPDFQPEFKDEKLVYQFNEPFQNYVMGGADRYMIFKFESTKSIQIFDLVKGDVVHTISNVDPDAILCAGSQSLFVVLPSQMLMQRWNLTTFKKEKTSRLPIRNTPQAVQIGVNSNNHILLYDGFEAYVVDVDKLKPIRILGSAIYQSRTKGERQFNVSADGDTFGSIPLGYGPVSYDGLYIGEKIIFEDTFGSTSNRIRWAQPSADGRLFFLPKGIIFNEIGKEITPKWLKDARTFPTVDPRYFIAVRFRTSGRNNFTTSVDVCTASDFRIIHNNLELDELTPKGNTNGVNSIKQKLDYGETQVHYVPWAGLLANVGYDNRTLYVRKYNVEAKLEESGEDYLFVESLPPVVAYKNRSLVYQVQCRSNSESISYRLAEGPSGMRLTPTGKLTWRPKRGALEAVVPVVITIISKNGDETTHTFDLYVMPDLKIRR